jgi:hypothetical protein
MLLLKDAPRHVGKSAPLSGGSSFDLLTQVLRELFVFHCALMQSRTLYQLSGGQKRAPAFVPRLGKFGHLEPHAKWVD